MKAQPGCLTCIFNQASNAVRLASDDPAVHEAVFRRLAAKVGEMSLLSTPAHISQHVYEIISEISGNPDPYKQLKHQTNERALALLPELEKLIFTSDDPLKSAVHLAVAGNVIDFGINFEMDLERDVLAIAEKSFFIDDLEAFRKELRPGVSILYIADNSGEIVFDRALVEELLQLKAQVTFCVKSGPIINDVMMEDAQSTGITDLVPVIETGSADIGINWERSSLEFKSAFEQADIVLSKGHGNFETLSESGRDIYFLLKTKCIAVAEELGVPLGAIVFKRQQRNRNR